MLYVPDLDIHLWLKNPIFIVRFFSNLNLSIEKFVTLLKLSYFFLLKLIMGCC